jgi:plasmid stability protein
VSFIQVKNVPEPLHEEVRRRAAGEGMTLSDYVLDLIRRDLTLPSRREWFDRVATRRTVDVDVISALDEGRGERDDHLART